MKKVSVIVAVYNVEAYLAKCLSSLVSQTLAELEILVINDGSTDGCARIIDEFQAKYPEKICAFYKENGGLSDARNFGLSKATGKYVGFVDGDDFVAKEMFGELYLLAEKHGAGIAFCNLAKTDEAGTITQKLPQVPNLPEKIDLRDDFSVFADLSYFACNKLFRRDLFDENKFEKGMHFEDIELIPKLLLKCSCVAHTDGYHYFYVERAESITKTHSEKGLDIFRAVQAVEQFFYRSPYAKNVTELRDFQILQGVYSYLAYLAFVKDDGVYQRMTAALRQFRAERGLSLREILTRRRFGKNYLLSLPARKKIYYLLYFLGQEKLLRKLLIKK